MIDTDAAEAIIHRRVHRVLGRRLPPLSLRHLLILDALDSPLAAYRAPRAVEAGAPDPGPALTPPDILLAVDVCQCRSDQQLAAVIDPPRGPRAWVHQLRRRWLLARRQDWWLEQLLHWSAYWEDFMVPPHLMPSGKKSSRQIQLPWQLMVAAALIRRGIPSAEAWWMPAGEALWLDLAMRDDEGAEYALMTDQRRAEFRALGHAV
jgi:hypothetical protein